MKGRRPVPCGGSVPAAFGGPARRSGRPLACVALVATLFFAPARAEAPPPLLGPFFDTVPVERPGGTTGAMAGAGKGVVPLLPLWRAESEARSGSPGKALPLFLDLANSYSDDERKGFVWMRIAELLLAKQELKQALEAADKAVLLSRARFLVLSSMDLKFRIYLRMGWWNEARQTAAYILDQGYINADPSELLLEMARADGRAGRISLALSEYGRAIAGTEDPQIASKRKAERDALIDGLTSIPVLREAAESGEDPEVRTRLYLQLGRTAVRKGFAGMGVFALEKASRGGGLAGEEAALQLFGLEKSLASRPKVVGLLPLSGKFADMGFSVLSGAEVALRQSRGPETELLSPVLLWKDTGGQPDRARTEFLVASSDHSVIGFIGPLTGEEGHSVSVAFDTISPPVLYLGQKRIPERPFLYSFGLTPQQEARAVLSYLAKIGKDDLILFFPDNGYGRGFAEAVASFAGETGVRVNRTVSYDPGTSDFTDQIRKAVGKAAFSSQSAKKEKGAAMKLPQEAILIADRWDKVFLLATQLRFYNVYLPLAGFSGWNDEELVQKAGEAVSGSVFSVDYSAAVPGFSGEKFRKDCLELLERAPFRFEAVGYDAALLLAESFRIGKDAGSRPGGELTREGIPRLRNFRGVTGTFQFEPAGGMRRKVSLLSVDLGNLVPIPEP